MWIAYVWIALEKLRYDEDRLQVNYTCDVDNPEQPISPLLLLPLVENAFKHGASEQYYDAHIDVTRVLRNGLLRLEVQNPVPAAYKPESGGIGLKNLRRQLELLYPGQYQLDFQKSATNYTATLTLQLPTP